MWQGELYIYLPANFGYAQDWTGVSEPRSQEQDISVIIIVVVATMTLETHIHVSVVPLLEPDG